jgi:hypothetical protein
LFYRCSTSSQPPLLRINQFLSQFTTKSRFVNFRVNTCVSDSSVGKKYQRAIDKNLPSIYTVIEQS